MPAAPYGFEPFTISRLRLCRRSLTLIPLYLFFDCPTAAQTLTQERISTSRHCSVPSYGHGRNSGLVAGVGRGAGLARPTADHSLSNTAGVGRARHRFPSRPAVCPVEPGVG